MNEEAVFTINGRFIVNSRRNEVTDREKGQTHRMEPRLMKLLCLLAEQNGEVVKREYFLNEIWDNYPGAGDGLNQAISFLRKILEDENKQIIQTVPKAGYSFNAIISATTVKASFLKGKPARMVIGVAALILLFFIIDKYVVSRNTRPITNHELDEKIDRETSRYDSIHQAQQTKFHKDTMGKAAKGDSIR